MVAQVINVETTAAEEIDVEPTKAETSGDPLLPNNSPRETEESLETNVWLDYGKVTLKVMGNEFIWTIIFFLYVGFFW